MKAKKWTPKDWQKDPNKIETERVQYWKNGVMMTVITKAEAQGAVQAGNAYVICGQAIEAL